MLCQPFDLSVNLFKREKAHLFPAAPVAVCAGIRAAAIGFKHGQKFLFRVLFQQPVKQAAKKRGRIPGDVRIGRPLGSNDLFVLSENDVADVFQIAIRLVKQLSKNLFPFAQHQNIDIRLCFDQFSAFRNAVAAEDDAAGRIARFDLCGERLVVFHVPGAAGKRDHKRIGDPLERSVQFFSFEDDVPKTVVFVDPRIVLTIRNDRPGRVRQIDGAVKIESHLDKIDVLHVKLRDPVHTERIRRDKYPCRRPAALRPGRKTRPEAYPPKTKNHAGHFCG